ncbi:MAG: hypothetical protein ACOWYE_01205 [Desulfatiglandales bacterium]
MKRNFFVIVFLVAFGLILQQSAVALIFLEQPEANLVGFTITDNDGFPLNEDDPDDTDQPYRADDPNVFVAQVTNEARRWVGVYVDRIAGGQSAVFIDNGKNDQFIRPVSDRLSISTLLDYFKEVLTGETNSRRYLLPLPEGMKPGDEASFRIKVLGPSWGVSPLPFYLTGPDAPDEAPYLVSALAYTLLDTVVWPAVKLILPMAGDQTELITQTGEQYIAWFGQNEIKLLDLWEKGEYSNILWEVFKFIGSDAMAEILKANSQNAESLAASLLKLEDIIKEPLFIGSIFDTVLDWAQTDWETIANVYFVYPKIEEIVPGFAVAGDQIVINGKGFDPYDPHNNKVFFTTLNESGTPVTTLEATSFSVLSEESIEVIVPDDYHPGPIVVSVSGYFSNSDVGLGDRCELVITEPQDNATVNGTITIAASVINPPTPFPYTTAVLLVNGEKKEEKQVSSPDLSFTADTGSWGAGDHFIEVRLTVNGQALSKTLHVTVQETATWYPPENQILSSQEYRVSYGTYGKKEINFSTSTGGELYIKITPKDSDTRLQAYIYGIGDGGTCSDTLVSNTSLPGEPVVLVFDLDKMYLGDGPTDGKCVYQGGNYIRLTIYTTYYTQNNRLVTVEMAWPK